MHMKKEHGTNPLISFDNSETLDSIICYSEHVLESLDSDKEKRGLQISAQLILEALLHMKKNSQNADYKPRSNDAT